MIDMIWDWDAFGKEGMRVTMELGLPIPLTLVGKMRYPGFCRAQASTYIICEMT